jgi:hypothetical protein
MYDVISGISIPKKVTQEPDAAGTTMNMHTKEWSETSVSTEIKRRPMRANRVLMRGKIEAVSCNLGI